MAQTKKLSVATVFGTIDPKAVLNAEAPIKVMTVFGDAVGLKTGTSTYGDYTALLGRFEAIHPTTGEHSSAAVLFLPDVALLPIQTALAQEGVKSIAFAIDIFVRASDNKKPGGSVYEYTFENVLPPAEDDPMSRMRKAVLEAKAAAAQLPAPPAPAPAPVPKGKGK